MHAFQSHICSHEFDSKKQTPVTRSSTECEIISLDAGLRMDGIPALDLWNLVVEVLRYSTNQVQRNQERARRDLQHTKPSSRHTNTQTKTRIQNENLELSNVDFVSSNVKSFRSGAVLYIFEDNEAVIKMIIKGRSPTTRHVSRTRIVAFGWLFGRINVDPKIQIRYVDTKNEMANMFTCVVLHFDIALVTTRFTRESLVTNVSLVHLTVPCVPEKLRDAFNLRSFLHECFFILLFIEGHNMFQHFDIAGVRARFTRESLVTNVSLENLTVACVWLL